MPTLVAQLPSTLEHPVSLAPQSSSAICSDIKKSASFKKKPTKGVGPKPKKPKVIKPIKPAILRPIDILETLGLAMLPPRHIQQNLASWHWTLIRYAYLIKPPSTQKAERLATNTLVGDYRYHHMTTLSEAFGVGCALSYSQNWLSSQIPASATVHPPIDFDYLLGPGAAPLPGPAPALHAKAAPNATRQPDYVIAAEAEDGTVRLLVVECKGNSKGRTKAIAQLGSAMHQLASVEFADGPHGAVPVLRHAYAAFVSKKGAAIEIWGVDPPEGEGSPWVTPAIPPRGSLADVPSSHAGGALLLPNVEEVSGRVVRRLADRAVAWAGAGDDTEGLDIRRLKHHESELGIVAGATSSLELPDGQTIEIFTGALVETLRALKSGDIERARAQRLEVKRALQGDEGEPRRKRPVEFHGDEDPERVASVMDDGGLALHIKVTSGG
jgi:hypothetical protein